MKESTGGKILLLCLPVVFAPSIAASVGTIPTWILAFGGAIMVLAEVGAACFFFPDQTVGRIYRWRAFRAAVRSGELRPQDVTRLLRRRRISCAPRLVRLAPLRAWEDPAYGRVVARWIRSGADLDLLADALKIPLTIAVLTAHLDRTTPLDPTTISTLAALHDEPEPPRDGNYYLLLKMSGVVDIDLDVALVSGISPKSDTDRNYCSCPLAHS